MGHFPEYMDLAKQMGSTRFNIPDHIWRSMSPDEIWAANQKFLERLARRGDTVVLSTPLDLVREGSYFARELDFLRSLGYKIDPTRTLLLPPGAK